MKHFATMLILAFSLSLLVSCSDDDDDTNESVTPNSTTEYKTPKYIFFFIGDGMAQVQINSTEAAMYDSEFGKLNVPTTGIGHLTMKDFPVAGMSTTHAEDRYITGSAAAATALACGKKTTIGTISMDGSHTSNYKTMAEMARDKGMKVGIISSVSIDHATPACFYAHTDSRNNYYTIGQHLTQSNFDYFAGGGVRWNKYDDEGQTEDINLFLNAAQQNGYTYVNTRAQFDALNASSGKVIATLEMFKTSVSATSAALPYIIDVDDLQNPNDKITLAEYTQKGIEVLDNDKGFFMMVEAGKVDWACHANDAVSALVNMMEFDAAIQKAVDFYNQHPDETLIVITGDHECGGLTMGYSATGYATAFELLKYQKESYEAFTARVMQWKEAGNMTFEQALEVAKEVFGLGDESKSELLALNEYEESLLKDAFESSMAGESVLSAEETKRMYGYYDPFTVTITHILNNKAGIDWTSYSHTGVPVPVLAMGQGQYEFSGYYDNTDVAKRIIKIAKLDE